MKKTIVIIVLTSLTHLSFAQMPSYEPSLYPRAIPNEGEIVQHRYQGESRVKYSKRVHRIIDGRMKQNKDIAWPRNALSKVIMHAVTQGFADMPRPVAYANDSLITKLTLDQIMAKGSSQSTFQIESPPGSGDFIDTTIIENFDVSKISQFKIMEDWLFDAQHGDLKPRIIAIAPIYPLVSESGISLGDAELFWIKMDDIRPILAQQEIFNKKNDAARLSYNHWFQMRLFASYITKESNVYDLEIAYLEEFKYDGLAALLEADKIKNDLAITEHDIWEY